jgi:hypothetical protein
MVADSDDGDPNSSVADGMNTSLGRQQPGHGSANPASRGCTFSSMPQVGSSGDYPLPGDWGFDDLEEPRHAKSGLRSGLIQGNHTIRTKRQWISQIDSNRLVGTDLGTQVENGSIVERRIVFWLDRNPLFRVNIAE